MAEGRMLNRIISTSKKMALLCDDTSRLLFTWMLAHCDVEGRLRGEAALFKAAVCPRLEHITVAMIEVYLQEWHDAGVIQWYKGDDGDRYIYCVGFERQQRGLRKDREAPSRYPAPPAEQLRSNSADTPGKGNEMNRNERAADLSLNLIGEVQKKVAENKEEQDAST
jgi:hypothetical protein